MRIKLQDPAPDHDREVEVEIEVRADCILLKPAGYGDHGTEDGHGCPVILELWEGRLRLLAWPDINVEDPQVTDLEGERCSCRKEDQ